MKSIGLMCFTIFILVPTKTQAEITHPYVVDEKPQVIFGDSVPIMTVSTTYFGLENYTQDYVNGYAHFTYTYTHHTCCFDTFSPVTYVTNSDPREVPTPVQKDSDFIYLIPSKDSNPNIDTNWFLYDVQFDATGYTVVVKEAGETEIYRDHREISDFSDTDWVALANRHPYHGPENNNSMAFTPVPVKESTSSKIDPVIIIPGIMGSARKNGELVIDPILHTYDDLIATLDENYYTPGVDLFTFPYEWRDSNAITANLLEDKIEEVKQICNCDKVDLVAHSMGGLVARQYVQSQSYLSRRDVDQLIFLGTPHKGSPKAYLQWEGGRFSSETDTILSEMFFQTESLRNGHSTIFDYIRDKPILSVKELLPITDYIKDNGTGVIRTYPNNYPTNIFLENLNSNVSALLDSDVKITNVIGNTGIETIEKIRVVPGNSGELWEHGKPDGFGTIIGDQGLEEGFGDRTVTVDSATLPQNFSNTLTTSSHNRIPTEFAGNIFSILTNRVATTIVDNGFQISPVVLLMQLRSPVDFVVTAPDGKKIGKNFATGGEFSEIPGAFYSGYRTDEEYITIPNPLDGEYKLELQGTDNGGVYSVVTNYISDATTTEAVFSGTTTPGQINTVNVFFDADAPGELSSDPDLVADINKVYEMGWITDKKIKDNLLKNAEKIIRIENRIEKVQEKLPNGKKKEKRIEKLEKKVDKVAARALLVDMRGYERDKINERAYNVIKSDLEWIINN